MAPAAMLAATMVPAAIWEDVIALAAICWVCRTLSQNSPSKITWPVAPLAPRNGTKLAAPEGATS